MPNPNEPSAGAINQSVQSKEELQALLTKRTEELRLALAEVDQTFDLVVDAFGSALEAKDPETRAHSARVCSFAIALCRAMGFPRHEIPTIARGAFLHDIGKLAVPDAILTKPGKLTELEVAIMREHPVRGYQMVWRVPFLSDAAVIIRSHHEWWDGEGYPNGLKGKEISIGARIVAVAEAFDCICSDMPYRSAQPIASAWEEISHWSGRQFDPQIVEVAVRIPEGLWSKLRESLAIPQTT